MDFVLKEEKKNKMVYRELIRPFRRKQLEKSTDCTALAIINIDPPYYPGAAVVTGVTLLLQTLIQTLT